LSESKLCAKVRGSQPTLSSADHNFQHHSIIGVKMVITSIVALNYHVTSCFHLIRRAHPD